jgi:hypothetical protein
MDNVILGLKHKLVGDKSLSINNFTIALCFGIIFFYAFVSINFQVAFDREYLDIRLYAIRDGASFVWRNLAEILKDFNNPIFVFYLLHSIFFAALLVVVTLINPFRSNALLFVYVVYAVLWWGLGQLRYGEALLLFLLALVSKRNIYFKVALTIFAASFHSILFFGFILMIVLGIKSRVVLGVIAFCLLGLFGYITLSSFDLYDIFAQVLIVSGYENYTGWIDNERTNTWLKQVVASIAIWWSLCPNSRYRDLIIVISGGFLILVSEQVFAGRSYTLFLGSVVPWFLTKVSKLKSETVLGLSMLYLFEIYILVRPKDVDGLLNFRSLTDLF